jgi:hypothetical protein
MFGGPQGDEQRHFLASRYLDPRVYQEPTPQIREEFHTAIQGFDAEKLWHVIQALPEEWKSTSAMAAMSDCLNRLADTTLLGNVFDTMMDAQRQVNQRERKAQHVQKRKTAASVLLAGIQSAGLKSGVPEQDLACA